MPPTAAPAVRLTAAVKGSSNSGPKSSTAGAWPTNSAIEAHIRDTTKVVRISAVPRSLRLCANRYFGHAWSRSKFDLTSGSRGPNVERGDAVGFQTPGPQQRPRQHHEDEQDADTSRTDDQKRPRGADDEDDGEVAGRAIQRDPDECGDQCGHGSLAPLSRLG